MDNNQAKTDLTALTVEQHQSYAAARKQQGMDYIDNYENWLDAHKELAALRARDSKDTWEESEHNPERYPDFAQFDADTQSKMIAEGNEAYWKASESLEEQILTLDTLLLHPDDIEKITDNLSEAAPSSDN